MPTTEPVHFLAPAMLNVAYEFGSALATSGRAEASVGSVIVVLVKEHLAMRQRLSVVDPKWHPHRIPLDELVAWVDFATSEAGLQPDAWPSYDPNPDRSET